MSARDFKVGQRYRTRSGNTTAQIVRFDDDPMFPVIANVPGHGELSFSSNGNFDRHNGVEIESDLDLVELLSADEPVAQASAASSPLNFTVEAEDNGAGRVALRVSFPREFDYEHIRWTLSDCVHAVIGSVEALRMGSRKSTEDAP